MLNHQTSYWKPQIKVNERIRPFLHRILRDFDYQWRHIFRNNFNYMTLRVLARAVIWLSTLQFHIHEETEERGRGPRGFYIWVSQLPKWEPLEANVLYVGKVHVVLCQSMQEGLSTAQQHATSHGSDNTTTSVETPYPDYMILSVKHIMLCHIASSTTLECTTPVRLFNGNHGVGPPSDLALDYLLWATATARIPISSPLQSLPIEVQNIVLKYVSAGPVAAAQLGYLLDLGTPFAWNDGSLDIELQETYTRRNPFSPVESQVFLGEHKSGLVYKGNVPSTYTPTIEFIA